MDAQSFAKVSIRLLAIYTLWRSLNYLPVVVSNLLSNTAETDGAHVGIIILIALTPLLLSAGLWIFSESLAKRIAGKVETTPSEQLRAAEWQAIILSCAGLIIVIMTLPTFVSYTTHNLFLGADETNLRIPAQRFVAPIVQVILGLALTFGSDLWVKLIRRFKTFGLKNK